MGKYEPLEHFLRTRSSTEVPMTFEEIELVIGGKLPPAAHVHRAWWSNNPSNNVMTKSWLAAGFKTQRVDVGGGKLVFRRTDGFPGGVSEEGRPMRGPGLIERLQARLGGTVTIAPGVDLTEPTGEIWNAER